MDALEHGGDRVGDGHARVVVEVAAERGIAEGFADLSDDTLHLVGEEPTVGVAQHDAGRAGVTGGAEH